MQNSPSSILSVDMEMKHSGDHGNNRDANTKFGIERHHQQKDGYPLMTSNPNHGGGFGAFTMEDIGSRFNVTTEQQTSFCFEYQCSHKWFLSEKKVEQC